MKTVAFYSNQLSERGTEVAMYNYARYNQELLGNKSVIITRKVTNLIALEKFATRFNVYFENYEDSSFESLLSSLGIEYLYITKEGLRSNYKEIDGVKQLIHCVFRFCEPHGDVYTYISDWLTEDMGFDPVTHSLPYMLDPLPEAGKEASPIIGIDQDKQTVFGCYGGYDQFNIPFVKEAILEHVNNSNDIFLFMNIKKFISQTHPQIKFLAGTTNLQKKAGFIRACDCMIHARARGETFGLAVGEFALEGKPIITYANVPERAHLDMLRRNAILYYSKEDLLDIFKNIKKESSRVNYGTSLDKYNPTVIIQKFKSLFLD